MDWKHVHEYGSAMMNHIPSDMIPALMPRHLKRNQSFVTVGTSSTQLLGPNPKRWAVLISSPPANFTDQLTTSQINNGVSTATTGIKSSFNVPAGQQAFLQTASMFETAGTTVVANLQIVRAGNTLNITSFTQKGVFNGNVPMQAGDTAQWNVTTAVAASVTDFGLFITQSQNFGRMTISLAQAAVIDQGMNQHPGQSPLILLYESIGDALREDIFAISANGMPVVGVWDFFT